MHQQPTRTAALALLFAVTSVAAQSTAPAHSAEATTLASPAVATATSAEGLSESQLAMAGRVYTGAAACEFNQQVQVQPLEQPGHFRVSYNGNHYTMTPEPTTTGAVRLEDRKAGIVWVQIPTKSMLLNHRVGQRMVDACTHGEQRVAVGSSRPARTASLQ